MWQIKTEMHQEVQNHCLDFPVMLSFKTEACALQVLGMGKWSLNRSLSIMSLIACWVKNIYMKNRCYNVRMQREITFHYYILSVKAWVLELPGVYLFISNPFLLISMHTHIHRPNCDNWDFELFNSYQNREWLYVWYYNVLYIPTTHLLPHPRGVLLRPSIVFESLRLEISAQQSRTFPTRRRT